MKGPWSQLLIFCSSPNAEYYDKNWSMTRILQEYDKNIMTKRIWLEFYDKIDQWQEYDKNIMKKGIWQ